MKHVITTKRNEDNDSAQTLQITNEFVCLNAHTSSNPDPEKRWYMVYDEFSMESYRVQVSAVNMLTDTGCCTEADAVCLMVLAKKALDREEKINNFQIASVISELMEVQGYAAEKLHRVIAGLGECDAKALFNHKKLPVTLDRYFMVEGWETNGLLEEAFCEKEQEDELYN